LEQIGVAYIVGVIFAPIICIVLGAICHGNIAGTHIQVAENGIEGKGVGKFFILESLWPFAFRLAYNQVTSVDVAGSTIIAHASGAQYKCYVKDPSEIQTILVNQQQGRYSEQQLQELADRVQQAAREQAAQAAISETVLSAFQVTNVPLDAEQRKIRITFQTIVCTIALFCYLFLGNLLFGFTSDFEPVDFDLRLIVPFFNIILLILYLCSYYTYVLRLWEEVPREFAQTTPENAAWFSLIPFFALYWMFTALVGLYRDMNKMTESNGLGTRFDPTWIVAACWGWLVLHMSSLFLFTIGVPFLAFLVFFFICMIVTIPMLWIIRKNVLEFIDIKESVGK